MSRDLLWLSKPHCPSAIEISEENLEDLLAYDDIFVDYFNAFLALPVSHCPHTYTVLTLPRLNENEASGVFT